MYKCKKCGMVFEEARNYEDYESIDVGNGRLTVADLGYSECPYCGSQDYDEAYECCECGEYFLEEEIINYTCKKCLNRNATIENLLKYGEKEKAEININYFLSVCFTTEEIEAILLKELEKSPDKETRKNNALDCCEEDFEEYIRKGLNR